MNYRLTKSLALSLLLPALLAPRLRAQDNQVCFECHNDPGMVDSKGDTLYVDSERFTASVHAQNGVECVGCHLDLAGREDWPHPERLNKVDCALCHAEAFELWHKSVHGLPAEEKGDLDAASCSDCHGEHYIAAVSDPGSPVYPTNLPFDCLKCHGDPKLAGKHEGMGRSEVVQAYLGSVHGQALEKSGLIISATCASCHGNHLIQKLDDFYPRIPKDCGTCHAGIYNDYLQGVHGKAFLAGNKDVPICTDCHGEHNILSPGNPESSVSHNQVNQVCSRCHDNMALSTKYGLPGARLESYMNTYHGIAMGLGDVQVANCASCHDFHNIRPSSDSKSTVSQANLAETCGKCHPNATENFAKGKVHIQGRPEENFGAWLIKKAYVVFIAGLIGGFIAYIFIDLFAHRRRRQAAAKDQSREKENK